MMLRRNLGKKVTRPTNDSCYGWIREREGRSMHWSPISYHGFVGHSSCPLLFLSRHSPLVVLSATSDLHRALPISLCTRFWDPTFQVDAHLYYLISAVYKIGWSRLNPWVFWVRDLAGRRDCRPGYDHWFPGLCVCFFAIPRGSTTILY